MLVEKLVPVASERLVAIGHIDRLRDCSRVVPMKSVTDLQSKA
jgi:hypothetical protein